LACAEIDVKVSKCIDKFFDDENSWQRVIREVSSTARPQPSPQAVSGEGRFEVQVPKPYPGVQYRKSKRLEDKYNRFAAAGSEVSGQVEDGGQWLRIGKDVFLPMRIGTIEILRPVPGDTGGSPSGTAAANGSAGGKPKRKESAPKQGLSSWWACCPGKDGQGTQNVDEVVVGNDLNVAMDDGRDNRTSAAGRH
jgi:hypothetical protein